MNDTDNVLSRDPYWDAEGINSMDRFQAMAARITLDQRLPQEVTNRFKIIKKLILYSYLAHEFLDAASEIAVLTFEMALVLRYKEITGEEPTQENQKLSNLVRWGANQGLFEDDEPIVDNLRKLRNDVAHPKTTHTLGPLALQLIELVADLCNGLYDDIGLRQARKSEILKTNSQLYDFVKDGAILEAENVKWIVFLATLLHYDNKSTPAKYYFLFWRIFDAIPKNDQVEEGKPIIVPCNQWLFSDGMFTLKDIALRKEVRLVSLIKDVNVAKFNKWKEDLARCDFPLTEFFKFRIGELRTAARRGELANPS